jgi:hypothetical protein
MTHDPVHRMRSYRVPDEEAQRTCCADAGLTTPPPTTHNTHVGRVAQLVRARRLQRRGHRFEPCHAHHTTPKAGEPPRDSWRLRHAAGCSRTAAPARSTSRPPTFPSRGRPTSATCPGFAAAVLSDGATRLVDRFSLLDWTDFLGILAEQGPEAIITQVRAAEASDPDGQRWPRGKRHDDASAAFCHLT